MVYILARLNFKSSGFFLDFDLVDYTFSTGNIGYRSCRFGFPEKTVAQFLPNNNSSAKRRHQFAIRHLNISFANFADVT